MFEERTTFDALGEGERRDFVEVNEMHIHRHQHPIVADLSGIARFRREGCPLDEVGSGGVLLAATVQPVTALETDPLREQARVDGEASAADPHLAEPDLDADVVLGAPAGMQMGRRVGGVRLTVVMAL